MDKIKFKGIIYRATFDRDGVGRLTLEVPQSDAVEIAKLSAYVGNVLKVEIEAEPNE